jgi:hypothetical protein
LSGLELVGAQVTCPWYQYIASMGFCNIHLPEPAAPLWIWPAGFVVALIVYGLVARGAR